MLQDHHFSSILTRSAQPIAVSPETLQSLHFPLPADDILPWLLSDPEAIHNRQQIFQDFLAISELLPTMAEALHHLCDLSDLSRRIGGSASHNESLLYSLTEISIFTETVSALHSGCQWTSELKSPSLQTFWNTIRAIAEDPQYISLCAWLQSLEISLRNIRSVTLGVNLNAQLDVQEVGIVSINTEPFVSSSPFDRIFRKETPSAPFTCLSVLGIRENGSLLGSNTLSINQEFYTAMNDLLRRSLKDLRSHLQEGILASIRSLLALQEELAFLCQCAGYIRKLSDSHLSLVFPQAGEYTEIHALANPLLLEKCRASAIVASDLSFRGQGCVYVLTGPNSGGKTVYTTAAGVAQILYQLGLPIPARSAVMRSYTTLVTHFVRETSRETESRLANEASRLKEVLDQVDRDTLLLLDETFSSTSAYDGLYLAEALMQYLLRTGCDCIYVTHLHGLSERIIALRQSGETRVQMLAAQAESGRRTYKIVPTEKNPLPTSMAEDIIRENGLGFLLDQQES